MKPNLSHVAKDCMYRSAYTPLSDRIFNDPELVKLAGLCAREGAYFDPYAATSADVYAAIERELLDSPLQI